MCGGRLPFAHTLFGVLLKPRQFFVFTLTTVTVWCGAGVVGESRDDLPGLEGVVYIQVLSRHFMDRPRKTTKYLTIFKTPVGFGG
jgi:hypothetical protein